MLKKDFFAALRYAVRGLPAREASEHIAFYEEMIDDKIEEGMSEAQAVRSLGGVEKVASQIIAQTPMTRIVREKIRPAGGRGALGITFLILGSPIWLSLLIAVFAVLISLYAAAISVIIAIWAVETALVAALFGAGVVGVFVLFGGHGVSGLLTISGALVSGGLAIFFFFGFKQATKGIAFVTVKSVIGIKKVFVRGI